MLIVTGGYGSGSTVGYIVTIGYAIGVLTPPDPGAGIPPIGMIFAGVSISFRIAGTVNLAKRVEGTVEFLED